MITKKQRKSSRIRSQGRAKKPAKLAIYAMDANLERVPLNRAAFREVRTLDRRSESLSVVQSAKQKRKDLQKASRVALRKMRKETLKAMRA